MRTVALAASISAVMIGVAGCTSGDDSPSSSPETSSGTTTDTISSTTSKTSSETTSPSVVGVELDVTAGGPYEGTAGSALLLTANLSVAGQSDTDADLEAIGAALVAYRNVHGSYPPAFLINAEGTPTVSWRVLLLPYLGETDLYERFDLTRAWDDPANQPLVEEIPDVFRADGAGAATSPERAGDTAYAGVAGAKHVFRAGATELAGGVAAGSVTDGDTMTIGVGPVGADVTIPWTSPGDVDTNEHPELGDPAGFDGPGDLVTSLLFLDGTVRTFPDDVGALEVLSWSTVAGDSCTPPASLAFRLVSGWDFDGDGEADAYGSTVEFPIDDPGEHEVSLSVEDEFGGVHVVTTTVTLK